MKTEDELPGFFSQEKNDQVKKQIKKAVKSRWLKMITKNLVAASVRPTPQEIVGEEKQS